MWTIFVLFITFVVGIRAGVLPGDRIVGGTATTIEKYPFIVQIEVLGTFSQVWGLSCGASILTTSALLTAAHCLEENYFLPTNHRIRAGTTAILGAGGTVINTEDRINYPDYVGVNDDGTYDSIDHDISIMFLVEELVYSNVIQPATIISHLSQFPLEGATVTTIGWGRIIYNGPLPDNLQEVQNHVLNQEECHRRYDVGDQISGFNSTISENMICTGILNVGGFAACSGDSGGPVLFMGAIVGVVSWSYECADSYFPDVNARVSTHTNWIVETVNNFESAYINNSRS